MNLLSLYLAIWEYAVKLTFQIRWWVIKVCM